MSIVTIDGSKWISGASLVHGAPSATYGRGRVCVAPGCGTLLSRYNPTDKCSIHNELH
jgi:hypothetical protein